LGTAKRKSKSKGSGGGGGGGDPHDRMLDRLKAGGLTLLVEREGRLVHASDRGGLKPLYDGAIVHPELFEGAEVADRVVGLAAAYLLVHARVARVVTPLIARDAEKAFQEAGIPFHATSRVKNLEDVPIGDGVSVEQLAHESVTPATFVEQLRTRFG
jgi:hypothetical protein